jgi:hypothetical protein
MTSSYWYSLRSRLSRTALFSWQKVTVQNSANTLRLIINMINISLPSLIDNLKRHNKVESCVERPPRSAGLGISRNILLYGKSNSHPAMIFSASFTGACRAISCRKRMGNGQLMRRHMATYLKRQCHENFDPQFLHQPINLRLQINTLKYFWILFQNRSATWLQRLILSMPHSARLKISISLPVVLQFYLVGVR